MATKTKTKIESKEDESLHEDSAPNIDTSPVEGMSKTNAMSVVMKHMADMTGDRFVEFFNAVQAQIGHHGDVIDNGAAGKNAASTAMKGDASKANFRAVSEDIQNIFGAGSEQLSEEVKTKMTTLFEAAVNTRVAFLEADLQEKYEEKLAEELASVHDTLVDKLDEYVSYCADLFMEENKVEFERSIRTEQAESFLKAMGQVFLDHNYNVPEDKVEVVDLLGNKVDALEEDNNQLMLQNIELLNLVEEMKKKEVISTMSENLTAIEADKFKTLVEGFDIGDNFETYVNKLETIKEHHFGKTTAGKTKLITEEIEYTEEQVEQEQREENKKAPAAPNMRRYLDVLNSTRR